MSNTQRLISIAMATYNGEKYLREQLDSILNQTYKNIEIIICDDNSSDDTVKIINEYKNVDTRISLYINQENKGYVKNFEQAISLCSGDYIALCDQDDIWLPEKLEILLNEIDSNSVIHSDAQLIDGNGNKIADSWTDYYNKAKESNFMYYIFGENNITGCTCMIRKEIIDILLPFPNEFKFHDMWIALIGYGNGGIKYLDRQLMQYRLHADNVIGANKINKIKTDTYVESLGRYAVLLNKSYILKLDEKQLEAIVDNIINLSIRHNSYLNFFAFKFAIKYYKYISSRSNVRAKFINIVKLFIGTKMINLLRDK